MKKDKLPRFASEAVKENQVLTEPPKEFKDKGYQKETSTELIANYDNYNYQKAYNGIKFNRFLSIQKASQKVENSFDDGEVKYPFVYSGGNGVLDLHEMKIKMSPSFSYPLYNFSKDDQEDGLGEHFYSVEKASSIVDLFLVTKDNTYTSTKTTQGDIVVLTSFTGRDGSVNFRFQENTETNSTLEINFNQFKLNNIQCMSNNGDIGALDIYLNGMLSIPYQVSGQSSKSYNFSGVDLTTVATLIKETGYVMATEDCEFKFIIGSGHLANNVMNFTIDFLLNNKEGQYPQGVIPVNKEELSFQDSNPTDKIENTVVSKQQWGVYLEAGFSPDGTENHQYILEKINTLDFDFENSRSKILNFIINPMETQKKVLFHILTKQIENESLTTYSLINNPLGERKQRLSFGISFPIGSVTSFAGVKSEIPNNYLLCDGREVLKADYPILFSKLLDRWGTSSDLSKFVLPDLVDQFVRGVDGITRNVGSIELDAGRNVTGSYHIYGANSVGQDWCFHEEGAFGKGKAYTAMNMATKGSSSTVTNGKTFDASRVWGAEHTSTEFRPQNKGVFYIIKAL